MQTSCTNVQADCGEGAQLAIGGNCYKVNFNGSIDPKNNNFSSTYQYGQVTNQTAVDKDITFLQCATKCVGAGSNCGAFQFEHDNSIALRVDTVGTCTQGTGYSPLPPSGATLDKKGNQCKVIYSKGQTANLTIAYDGAVAYTVLPDTDPPGYQQSGTWQLSQPFPGRQVVLGGIQVVPGSQFICAIMGLQGLELASGSSANLYTYVPFDGSSGGWGNCDCACPDQYTRQTAGTITGAPNCGVIGCTVNYNLLAIGNVWAQGVTVYMANIFDYREQHAQNVGSFGGPSNQTWTAPPSSFVTGLKGNYSNHQGLGFCYFGGYWAQPVKIPGKGKGVFPEPRLLPLLLACQNWSCTWNTGAAFPIQIQRDLTVTSVYTDYVDGQDLPYFFNVTGLKDQSGKAITCQMYAVFSVDPQKPGIKIRVSLPDVTGLRPDASDINNTGTWTAIFADNMSLTFVSDPSCKGSIPPDPKNLPITLVSTSGQNITIDVASGKSATQKPVIQQDYGGVECRKLVAAGSYTDASWTPALKLMTDWCADHKSVETCVAFCNNPTYSQYCPWTTSENKNLVFGLTAAWFLLLFLMILGIVKSGSGKRKALVGGISGAVLLGLGLYIGPKLYRLITNTQAATTPEFKPNGSGEPDSVKDVCKIGTCQFPQCKDYLATSCYCPNACSENTQCKNGKPCVPDATDPGKFSCLCGDPGVSHWHDDGCQCDGNDPKVWTDQYCTRACLPSGTLTDRRQGGQYPNDWRHHDPSECCSGQEGQCGQDYCCT